MRFLMLTALPCNYCDKGRLAKYHDGRETRTACGECGYEYVPLFPRGLAGTLMAKLKAQTHPNNWGRTDEPIV